MNYVALALFALIMIYLQYSFLSFLNLIIIGLLVGVMVAFENNTMILSIYIMIMSVIILIAFVFKIIHLINTLTEFNIEVS